MIDHALSILRFITNHPLSTNRKTNAIMGFVRWQLATKLVGSRLVVDWVDDSKFITRKGETGLTGNLYCGFMEYEDMCFLLHYLRESDEFYDIGANVGAYTILASSVRGCRSFTFEPLPNTFDRLVDQIKINRIEHLVFANNKGVGSQRDVLEFTNSLNCMNRVNTDPNNKEITKVEVTTLDDEFDPQKNSVIKVDVEGYESFVLDGGKKFFSNENVTALILELNGSGKKFGVSDKDIDKMVRSYRIRPIQYKPKNRIIEHLDAFNEGGNTIYLKDATFASQRCKNSEKVVVHTAGGTLI